MHSGPSNLENENAGGGIAMREKLRERPKSAVKAVLEFLCIMQVSSSTPGMALATKSNLVEDIIPDVLLCAIIFENCYKVLNLDFQLNRSKVHL